MDKKRSHPNPSKHPRETKHTPDNLQKQRTTHRNDASNKHRSPKHEDSHKHKCDDDSDEHSHGHSCHKHRENKCCSGLAEAYGAYFEAAGSLYQEKLTILNNIGLEPIDYDKLFAEFNILVDYFGCNVRFTLEYLQNNCQDSCCGDIALAVAKISIGALESVLTLINTITGTNIIGPEINKKLQNYASTVQQLVRNLCEDDCYVPLIPPVIPDIAPP